MTFDWGAGNAVFKHHDSVRGIDYSEIDRCSITFKRESFAMGICHQDICCKMRRFGNPRNFENRCIEEKYIA